MTRSLLIGGTTALYQVDFDRDVTNCAYAASSWLTAADLVVEPRGGAPNGVFVSSTASGAATPDEFYLTVTC